VEEAKTPAVSTIDVSKHGLRSGCDAKQPPAWILSLCHCNPGHRSLTAPSITPNSDVTILAPETTHAPIVRIGPWQGNDKGRNTDRRGLRRITADACGDRTERESAEELMARIFIIQSWLVIRLFARRKNPHRKGSKGLLPAQILSKEH
jgi:hypothetical protein